MLRALSIIYHAADMLARVLYHAADVVLVLGINASYHAAYALALHYVRMCS